MSRVVMVARPPAPRLLRACAAFGLRVRRARGRGAHALDPDLARRSEECAALIDASLARGGACLVTGASGSGKSCVLRALEGRLRARRAPFVRVDPGTLDDAPLVELVPAPLEDALRLLARAGLAEAMLLARAPAELSEGERWRASLAVAVHRARRAGTGGDRPMTLIADEFASTLDRLTAASVARIVARRARADGFRLVCATAHEDLAPPLRPGLVVRCEAGDRPCARAHAEPVP